MTTTRSRVIFFSCVAPLLLGGCADFDDTSIDEAPGTAADGLSVGGGLEQKKPTTPPDAYVSYDEVRFKSTHNSYEHHETLLDQLVHHRVRSLELDLVATRGGFASRADDWFVFHERPGFDSHYTTCTRLSDCLDQLRTFHLLNPDHSVVTVFLDMKRSDAIGYSVRNPSQLDQRLFTHLPPSSIFTPADLAVACPGVPFHADDALKQALATCGWPSLEELRGKFIFVLTGKKGTLDRYIASSSDGPTERWAFASSKSYASSPDYAVFINGTDDDIGSSDLLAAHGARHISRVYNSDWAVIVGGINDANEWDDAVAGHINHIATDKVTRYKHPTFTTHSPNGYPAACHDSAACSTDAWSEPGEQLLTVEIETGGQLGGASDSVAMLAEPVDDGAYVIWNAYMSNANSFMSDSAEAGCLMVRADDTADAAFFAVCRRGPDRGVFATWRTGAGMSAQSMEADPIVGINGTLDDFQADDPAQDGVGFLELRYDATSRCALALVSRNGQDWHTFHNWVCFNEAMTLQGVAAGSHGSQGNTYAGSAQGRVATSFVNLEKNVFENNVRQTTQYDSPADFPLREAIGSVPYLRCWAGFSGPNWCLQVGLPTNGEQRIVDPGR